MRTAKSHAHTEMTKGFDRMSDLSKKKTTRPVITRGRHLEEQDWHQLPVKSSNTLTDTDGIFFFILGFSIVGGPDRVRP